MEKVYFQNYTKLQINVCTEGREIQLGPECEEWLTLPVGPLNVTLAAYLVGFKKKRETFQIEIKEGTNYVDILMDEEVQKNSPYQNRTVNFSFLIFSISTIISSYLNTPLPLFDLNFFTFNTFHLNMSLLLSILITGVIQAYKRSRRMKQLSTVFVLDAH
jgi:hypothetical protein